MRPFVTAALFGALVAAAPAFAHPDPYPRRGVSPESRDIVAGWYERFLHRRPDDALIGWAQALDQGERPERLVARILGGDEYYIRAGSNPEGFVRNIYRDVVGRDPTRREYDAWVGRLNQYGREDSGDERLDMAYGLLVRFPQTWQPAPREDDYDYRRQAPDRSHGDPDYNRDRDRDRE